jgi:hypothetical protein
VTDRQTGRLVLALATAGFVASALLHLATFTPYSLPGADVVALALFGGAFATLVAMIARLRRAGAPARAWRGVEVYQWRALAALVPPPLRVATVGVALYTLMNFTLSIMLGGARPAGVRLLTGHLLLFYLLPLLYFRFVDPRRAEIRSGGDRRDEQDSQ